MGYQPGGIESTDFIIGVTGHRQIPSASFVRPIVAWTLSAIPKLLSNSHKETTIILSALAEGADRLVAEFAPGVQTRRHLRVILPFASEEYEKDIGSQSSLMEFHTLLEQAESVKVVPNPKACKIGIGGRSNNALLYDSNDERNAAYERCGQAIVDECDILLSIWDGMAARGRGGTAEIVAYARNKRKPMVWILPKVRCKVTYENFEHLKSAHSNR